MQDYLRFFREQRKETEERIFHDTQRHRKAYARLEVFDDSGKPVDKVKVNIQLKRHEFLFGCNLFMLDQFPDAEHNQQYRQIFPELFNYAVAPFYWSDFELVDGQPRIGDNAPDVYRRPSVGKILAYCRKQKITLKGHPLFWHLFLPSWLPRDREESLFRIDRRLGEIASAYGDLIRDWDVVNESLSRTSHSEDARLPSDYVCEVFQIAQKYFQRNRLFINETTECVWKERFLQEMSAYYLQIENLRLKGTQIDGIGLQYHLFYPPQDLWEQAPVLLNPHCLFNVLDTYGRMQIPLHVSEITVPAYDATPENMQIQAEITEWLYRIWFSHPQCQAIVWWNLVDGTAAYAPLGSKEGENYYAGGLLHYDMSRKPVYEVLDQLINQEWRTQETLQTEQGSAKFHGFFGDYEVILEKGGIRKTRYIRLSAQGDRNLRLTF